jgi:lipopolysaccharide transport system ATP-binding protein
MSTAIKVENVSKQYRLGKVGTGTIVHDFNRWWHLLRGKDDPYLKIGETNDRSKKGETEYVWALQDINFKIEQGEAVGIIGRNGAGKSTLLKILSRTTGPTTGNIKLRGRVASLLEVGTGFHPELSGRENIYLNGAILGMTRKEITRKFDEIVDFSGVERYIDTPVKRYSSGMYVRLAFAVAAHLESEILIVDEVLAVGDAEFQKKCLGKMNDVSKGEGRTVLFVSHNMAMIKTICTNAILLQNGNITYVGNSDETVSYYLNSNNISNEASKILHESEFRLSGMNSIIEKVELTNSEGDLCSQFSQNDEILIHLFYNGINISDVIAGAGFVIFNGDEIRVGGGNTYMAFKPPHRLPKDGKIVFKIENKQFNPGKYLLTVALGSHQSRLIDKIEKFMTFEIISSDIYNTGYLLTKEDGVSVINFSAKIVDKI